LLNQEPTLGIAFRELVDFSPPLSPSLQSTHFCLFVVSSQEIVASFAVVSFGAVRIELTLEVVDIRYRNPSDFVTKHTTFTR